MTFFDRLRSAVAGSDESDSSPEEQRLRARRTQAIARAAGRRTRQAAERVELSDEGLDIESTFAGRMETAATAPDFMQATIDPSPQEARALEAFAAADPLTEGARDSSAERQDADRQDSVGLLSDEFITGRESGRESDR